MSVWPAARTMIPGRAAVARRRAYPGRMDGSLGGPLQFRWRRSRTPAGPPSWAERAICHEVGRPCGPATLTPSFKGPVSATNQPELRWPGPRAWGARVGPGGTPSPRAATRSRRVPPPGAATRSRRVPPPGRVTEAPIHAVSHVKSTPGLALAPDLPICAKTTFGTVNADRVCEQRSPGPATAERAARQTAEVTLMRCPPGYRGRRDDVQSRRFAEVRPPWARCLPLRPGMPR